MNMIANSKLQPWKDHDKKYLFNKSNCFPFRIFFDSEIYTPLFHYLITERSQLLLIDGGFIYIKQ